LKNPPIRTAIGSPLAFNYRNHVQFHLSPEGRLGFQAARQNQVIPVNECHLPETALNQVWPLFDFEPVPGVDRVGLRLGADEDVLLVLEGSEPEPIEFSVEELDISAVQLGPGGALVLAGSESLRMEVLGRSFQVSAGSFFQVNTAMAEAMVNHLLELLPVLKTSTLLDVYSGVGLFSAFFADRVERLVAIEVATSACQDYLVNLDEFDNVELYEAPAEVALGSVDFHPDAIIVDPPRAGLEGAALDGLLRQQPKWLAYVSCDPATLARDVRRLAAGGYELVQVTPFDLFPQTYHVETVSLFEKSK
jgi:23S rRNA (uracil1939-C5)-methyltransferase